MASRRTLRTYTVYRYESERLQLTRKKLDQGEAIPQRNGLVVIHGLYSRIYTVEYTVYSV